MSSEITNVQHIFKHVANNNGEINLPLNKSLQEMTGGEILALLTGFKNVYMPEVWLQKTKVYVGIESELDLYDTDISLDAINRVAALLNIKSFFTKQKAELEAECLFDDDTILRPITNKFNDGKKDHEYITSGFHFYKINDVAFVVRYDNDVVSFFCHIKNKDVIEKLSEKLTKWAKEQSMLKNKVVRLDGTIIPMEKKYTWDDVILEDSVKETIIDNIEDFLRERVKYKANNVPFKRGMLLHGPPGTGKAQPLSAKILTPTGWTSMGDIKIGDNVIGSNGKPCRVLGVFPQGEKEIYRVTFSDKSSTNCCKEHLWETSTIIERTRKNPTTSVKSLEEIMETIVARSDNRLNHKIPMVDPIHFAKSLLPIDPYLMGVLVGDGCFINGVSITNISDFVINKISKLLPDNTKIGACRKHDSITYPLIKEMDTRDEKGYMLPNNLVSMIKEFGLFNKKSSEKVLPSMYMFASIEDRIKILHGLFDTDGTVDRRGHHASITTTSPELAEQIQFLVQSLGGTAPMTTKKGKYKTQDGCIKICQNAYMITINLPNSIPVCSMPEKLDLYKPKTKYKPKRLIKKIEYIGKEQAQCILVDSNDHLYVTDNCILTHNTLIGKVLACKTKVTFLWVTAHDIMNQDIRSAFTLARKLAPAIIFLEDMDMYASRRDGGNAALGVLGELLAQMDGFESNEGIIVIGTTNDYEAIDEALSQRPSRFDKVIEVPKPSTDALREKMLKAKFGKHNTKGLNFEELAKETNDFSGSHIEELVTLSVIEAVKDKAYDDKFKVKLNDTHVKAAIGKVNLTEVKSTMGINFDDDEDDEEVIY